MRPSCGGHRGAGLFFLKKTWLVMSLSGAISPLDVAVCMTWLKQGNEPSQKTLCTPWPQDTSWESGTSLLRVCSTVEERLKDRVKRNQLARETPWERIRGSCCLSGLHLLHLTVKQSLSVNQHYTTAISILQGKCMCWREKKSHLPHREIRQKLSGNHRPLNCCGFLDIKHDAT